MGRKATMRLGLSQGELRSQKARQVGLALVNKHWSSFPRQQKLYRSSEAQCGPPTK